MSELILHKKARQLCIGEGKAWSLKDFENGVPGVTMLTVVADEKKRREYLGRARIDAQTEFQVTGALSRPQP